MGEHDTLYTVLMPEFWARLTNQAEHSIFGARRWEWVMFGETHYSLIHVAAAVITVVFLIFATYRWRREVLHGKTEGIVPPREWHLPAMLNNFVSATYNMTADVMGDDNAKKWLPLVGTLALFIFVNNIQGLIPGLLPATDTLKTNLALALMVFVIYNVVGLYNSGLHYLAHFAGPSFKLGSLPKFPWLFPLMVPIEVAHHFSRPVSLSLRLMGNILADHKVVGAVLVLVPLLVPVPFLLLGVLVAIIQTVIFTLLTVIYIAVASEHAQEH
jgi:F-type H+-transporting ATPase subunit a